MKILIKLFSVLLLVSFIIGCGRNKNDEDDQSPPAVVIIPKEPAAEPIVYNTLYLSEDWLSVSDPDNISSGLDNDFPVVVPHLNIAETSYTEDHNFSVSDAIQDYESVLTDGRLTDNSTTHMSESDTASVGHLVYGLLKLVWTRGLEARKDFYVNALVDSTSPDGVVEVNPVGESGGTVSSVTLNNRSIYWDSDNNSIRSEYGDYENELFHATEVTLSGDNVSIVYGEETPTGKTIINIEKTSTGIQMSGILVRDSFYDLLESGQHTTQVKRDNITMYFVSRITDDGIAVRFCSLEAGITYKAWLSTCVVTDSINDSADTWNICNTRAEYAGSRAYKKACTFFRWYTHPADTAYNLDHSYGIEGSTWWNNTVNSIGGNTKSFDIPVDAPTIDVPVFPF